MHLHARFHYLIATFWLCLTSNSLEAQQSYIYNAQTVGIKDGLPNRSIYDIVQDQAGYLWLSCTSGIIRYDGYHWKTFPSAILHTQDGVVPEIALGPDDRLYYMVIDVGGNATAGAIDLVTNKVLSLAALTSGRVKNNEVAHISNASGDAGAMYVVMRDGGVYRYKTRLEKVYHFPKVLNGLLRSVLVTPGQLWIADEDAVTQIVHGQKKQYWSLIGGVSQLIMIDGHVVVETYNSSTQKLDYVRLDSSGVIPFTLLNASRSGIKALCQFQTGLYCVATAQGIHIQDADGRLIYKYDYRDADSAVQNRRFIAPILDHMQTFWASTGNGLLKITSHINQFHQTQSGNSMRAIYQSGDLLWMGGYFGNVVQNLKTGAEEPFLPPGITAMSAYQDQQGQMWVGTGMDLVYAYDTGNHRFIEHDLHLGYGPYLVHQNAATEHYWIGSEKGLLRFDPHTNHTLPFELPSRDPLLQIRQIFQNDTGMWILSNQGLFLLDAQSETLRRYWSRNTGMPTDNLNHMHVDRQGVYWIGTRDGGLLRWDHKADQWLQISTADGLANNNIYAVYEDDFGSLWLPSDYGLMAYNKTTRSIKNFLPRDGIAHEEFNTFSHLQASDGTLYFGGLNGVTIINPRDIQRSQAIAPLIHASQVHVLEADAETFTDYSPAFMQDHAISLPAGTRMLEIDLALMDFEDIQENEFAYQLDGPSEHWTFTHDHQLVFNNLSNGSHELVVKGRGASGQWSSNLLKIPITVLRPYYLRWPFIAAMVLMAVLLVLAAFRLRVRQLERERNRLTQEVSKRTAQIERDKQTITQQAAGLMEMDRVKSRFFANITHEFRTPLTLVMGPVGQILDDHDLPPTMHRKLSGVHRNAEHLLALINQLLDLSKLEQQMMQVDLHYGDIVSQTHEQVQRLQPLAEQKDICLWLELPLETHTLLYDSDKWDKIVFNLLSNALKFTPAAGEVTLRLRLAEADAQKQIVLEVQDTGIGIAAADQGQIFERFFQVDGSTQRLRQGSGLGLALVRELVELQGGHIGVQSTLGQGTTFILQLPIRADQAASPRATQAAVLPPSLQSIANREISAKEISSEIYSQCDSAEDVELAINEAQPERLLILLIEDNAEMRSYIRSCLDPELYAVLEATDGLQGIAMAQAQVPDLIVSDVMMPGADGYAVTTAIRGHVVTSHIPLILLTAKASLDSRLQGIASGADAHLTKPFSPAELTVRVAQLIAQRQLLRLRYGSATMPNEEPETEKAQPAELLPFQFEDKFVVQLRAYIDAHLSDPDLNGDRIGDHFAMSRMQLHRKLKALTNTSISEFVRQQRLAAAKRLLTEGQLTVSEVAYETGFTAPSHFSRTFRKEFGIAPSELS